MVVVAELARLYCIIVEKRSITAASVRKAVTGQCSGSGERNHRQERVY
jgi:hypothetical protein